MSLRSSVIGQFKQPHGLLGHLAGFIMANRPSNRERNEWTVGLLALEPTHKVLEIGCGPGLALKSCAAKIQEGYVVGIDHSPVMIRQAQGKLAEEIKAGRAEVRLDTLAGMAAQSAAFDRVYSANVVQFLSDLNEGFGQIRDCLIAGGMVATTYQPRSKNPTRANAIEMATRIEAAMKSAGFEGIERHELALDPAPAICVIGVNI